MARRTARWLLSLQTTLFLLLIFVRGNEDAEDAYKNGRNLVLEYFLPINLPAAVDPPFRREKRDVEGSGEEETVFSGLTGSKSEETDNSTQNAFAKIILQEQAEVMKDEANAEGSGEVDESSSESSESSSEEKSDGIAVPIIGGSEVFTTTEEVVTTQENNRSKVESDILTSTEMIFDKSEDFQDISTMKSEETTAETPTLSVNTTAGATSTEAPTTVINTTTTERETTTMESSPEETTTEELESKELTTPAVEVSTAGKPQTTIIVEETTTLPPAESVTIIPHIRTEAGDTQTTEIPTAETTTLPFMTTTTTTETPTVIPVVIPHVNPSEEPVIGVVNPVANTTTTTTTTPTTTITTTTTTTTTTTVRPTQETAKPSTAVPSTVTIPKATGVPVVEEIFEETKIGKKLEALPGNILQKENLSLAADPLLVVNTRLMDSEENVQLSSSEPKRLGAYIVIGLILLSFSSLVGYITFRKRMNRKRQEFESNQESHDTEKALLSLSDYKDNSELEENHLKNNEITPIVVKSNSQINKFEKNTNFSSPKNLNTIANEKNIEKDNVLKSTAENLTQVIIEDSPKDLEEEKNAPNLEKLIVKTRIDQDSIPKKPIIINRSSAGYLPVPQDNS